MWKVHLRVDCWRHIDSLQMVIIGRSPDISDTNSPHPDTVYTIHQYQKVLSHQKQDLSNAFLAHVQVFSSSSPQTACAHIHTHACTYTRIHTQIHTYIHKHIHAHTHIQTQTHAHKHTHTNTHTHIHTQTHTHWLTDWLTDCPNKGNFKKTCMCQLAASTYLELPTKYNDDFLSTYVSLLFGASLSKPHTNGILYDDSCLENSSLIGWVMHKDTKINNA